MNVEQDICMLQIKSFHMKNIISLILFGIISSNSFAITYTSINSDYLDIVNNWSCSILLKNKGVIVSTTEDDTKASPIDIDTAYADYENIIAKVRTIKDPVEKARKENIVYRYWILILDMDIHNTIDIIFEQTVESQRRKFENSAAALLLLKDEKEFLIARNKKNISQTSQDN